MTKADRRIRTHDDALPFDLMKRRLLLDHDAFALETGLLLAEATVINLSTALHRSSACLTFLRRRRWSTPWGGVE
jgi:hypothetical protein